MKQTSPTVLKCVSRQIDYATICRYGELTADPNPIHTDREFAAKTEMGGIIAHGTLSLNLIWQSIRKTFGADIDALAVLDVRFLAPVREDDIITAGGLQVEDAPGRFEVWARNQAGRDVIRGRLEVSDLAAPGSKETQPS